MQGTLGYLASPQKKGSPEFVALNGFEVMLKDVASGEISKPVQTNSLGNARFRLQLRANAPEGQNRFPISLHKL